MAWPNTLITDFRHLDAKVQFGGRSLTAFLASIVAAGSLEGPEARIRTPLRCRCRPQRRACPGSILIARRRGCTEIEWRCSECEFNGIITHWEDSQCNLGKAAAVEDVEVLAPETTRNRIPAALVGRWRIVEMEVWDREVFDLNGPALIELAKHGGSLRFVAVEGGLDCRYGEVGGRASVEFSWRGADDREAACGRGWANLQKDGSLTGRIFIHDGDDSSFTATRFHGPPRTPRRQPESGASGAALVEEVRQFHRASFGRQFYESFRVNSKNFMEKSKGTRAFIAELDRLVSKCVLAANGGSETAAREGFDLLFAVLRRIDEDSDSVIFFADEGGVWQLGVDWKGVLRAYFRCLAKSASAEEYVREVDRAISDFSEFNRPLHLAAARRVADKEQKAALRARAPPSRSVQ